MVSPRKSRKKSGYFSSTTTLTPARASKKPSIIPAGPPPAIQHFVVSDVSGIAFGSGRRLATKSGKVQSGRNCLTQNAGRRLLVNDAPAAAKPSGGRNVFQDQSR